MLNQIFFKYLWIVFLILLIPLTSYSKEKAPDKSAIIAKTAKLRIPFIENQGQMDKQVKFYANTFAGNVYVTEKGEIIYRLVSNQQSAVSNQLIKKTNTPEGVSLQTKTSDEPRATDKVAAGNQKLRADSRVLMATLKETLIGAKDLKVSGKNKAATKVNYFVGDKKDWKNNISSYDEVSLGEVYNNIELKLKAYGKNVEKLFTVNPKGKVEDISLNVEGSKSLKVNKNGELEVETDLGSVKFTKPYAYQDIDGKKVEVACQFQVSSPKSQVKNIKPEPLNLKPADPNISTLQLSNIPTYSFKVASYNTNYPLIIDPLLASTFIGGGGWENSSSMAIDSSGNVFVTGYTYSSDFPTTPGAYNTSKITGPHTDVFISKLSNDLSSLLASTFIGGTSWGDEAAASLAIDSQGNIFVTGYTMSSSYPVTQGAYDTSINGIDYHDVFISKLSNDLSSLLASTFIGGNDSDDGYSIAVDSQDNIFVTGRTLSSNYPITPGAYDTSYDNSYYAYGDVFVSKLNNNLTSLLASTFIGGTYVDAAAGSFLAIDSQDNIFVTGGTLSADYPTTSGSYDTFYNGGEDVFISKLNNNLTSLLASTFIGGTDFDRCNSIALDSQDNLYILGTSNTTFSNDYYSSPFPTTPGSYDTSYNGMWDVFISKINNNLTSLLASTFLGGGNSESGYSIAIDSSGNVFVTGYTYSSDFPTTPEAYDTSQNSPGSYEDVFISKLNNNLTSLLASTFLGGGNWESGYSIAIDSQNNIFVTGGTASSDYPTTLDAYDPSFNNGRDVFVSKLDNNLTGPEIPTAITLLFFSTEAKQKNVVLRWKTGTEINNVGFNILKSSSEKGKYSKINKKLIPAKMNTTSGTTYKYVDEKVKSGKTYYYKLEDIDRNGTSTLHGPMSVIGK